MNEAQLTTIKQIEQFLSASTSIRFSAAGDDGERYEHISRVLKRFDYPGRTKREHGVLLRYLQHTSGYSLAQVTRLVTRWQRSRLAAVPLAKLLCACRAVCTQIHGHRRGVARRVGSGP